MTEIVYTRSERRCEQCGEPFWGTARAAYCSKACRQRAARARAPYGLGGEIAILCAQMIEAKREGDKASPRKLLPRLFRVVARELREQGWDPIELLLAQKPDDPVSEDDTAPGGIEGVPGNRRKWLFPPEEEFARLQAVIAQRKREGGGVEWYERRRDQLERLLRRRGVVAESGE
jgi:hypothetical protein